MLPEYDVRLLQLMMNIGFKTADKFHKKYVE